MPNILLGLTGSVASVLAPKLIEALGEVGDVAVITTEKVSHFVPTYVLLEAVGANPVKTLPFFKYGVFTDREEWLWQDKPEGQGVQGRDIWKKEDPIIHIELRKWADVMVVAPLSANTLAKMANGLCDNLLTSVFRAWDFEKPVVVAPAMNSYMWNHPVTKKHLETIHKFFLHHIAQEHPNSLSRVNFHIVNPTSKELACGDVGIGALANIDDICKKVQYALENKAS